MPGALGQFAFCHRLIHQLFLKQTDVMRHVLLVGHHLVGLQVGVAQRDGYRKFTTWAIAIILHSNGTVVQLYQRPCQVQTDASTCIAVIGIRRQLIETLEHFIQLIFGNTLTGVLDSDLHLPFHLGDTQMNLSACRGEFKGIAEDVDHHLVKVCTVNPYR